MSKINIKYVGLAVVTLTGFYALKKIYEVKKMVKMADMYEVNHCKEEKYTNLDENPFEQTKTYVRKYHKII